MSSSSERVGDLTSEHSQPESGPALLPLKWRAYRPPHWWFEIILILVLDTVYEHLRDLVPLREKQAYARGWDLFHFEQHIGFDVELTLNHFVMRHHWIAQAANYGYAVFAIPVIGVLIWLFVWHRRVYKTARSVLAFTTILGLIGFWLFPTAPPRLLQGAGFVDTTVYFHTIGSWGSRTVSSHSNLFAAMPSLHCGWALWVGLSLFFVARHPVLRALGVLYPLWTLFVVMATANHFIVDAIAGYFCVGVSVLAVWLLFGHNPWTPARDEGELTLTRDAKKVAETTKV
ncbi:phosphatase PAP2 family protein [Flexivirga caeni]|uniref:Phosphatase PAP2 family protein n=1 Tax=Flexivirga caeni TaxID=2294115 RepID=A0A3M9M522_9MICO|nr:phosphatase PAP2 family protein [Flexivirga caeni]RNI20661.1 phosphatase PAP2 family protein [Flexivirga caeni]